MKWLKTQKLNTRLLSVFFAAVSLLSLANFFSFFRLLENMEEEEYSINTHLLNSVTMKVDSTLDEIKGYYTDMAGAEAFKNLNSVPSAYELSVMHTEARQKYDSIEYIHSWVIHFRDGDKVISNNGAFFAEEYVNKFICNKAYNADFWKAELTERFSRKFYPEMEMRSISSAGGYETNNVMPLAMKTYFGSSMMTVLFLNIADICKDADIYLEDGIYIFSEAGELLYTSDDIPAISSVPETRELSGQNGMLFAVQSMSAGHGLTYVKLLPQSQVMTQVRSNFLFCLGIALAALVISVILVLTSVKRMMDPVNRMLSLLRQHSEPKDTYNVYGACKELEQILKSRDEQEALLIQKDAALSEYFLQARLKNVYVNLEQQKDMAEGSSYILYIQVQYQEKTRQSISMPQEELEKCLQEMMYSCLNELFAATIMFQLEPGRFAARVTLPPNDHQISSRMARFMERLQIEQEFAWFTVVQSDTLTEQEDLASVYSRVLDTAKQALVCDRSQLLIQSSAEETALQFQFTRQDEKKLYAHVRAGETEEAAALAERILLDNLEKGISYAQMEVLCVAIVNTASYAATELTPSAEKIAAASGVYNLLTSKCRTAREYCETVTSFIQAAGHSEMQPAKDDPLLQMIQQYIKNNYHREFDGEEMAKDLGVSRNYLSTYYKSRTGMNLSDSIQLYRIQKAVDLLKDPTVKIGDIGPMVGISSVNTFLRQFKKHTGVTPKEWRIKNMDWT